MNRAAVSATMAASSQCTSSRTPASTTARIVPTKPAARASKVGRTMNTLIVGCPTATSASSVSVVADAGSETMG